jgi:imidazolonepropionase-like amidohydrolase
VLLVTGTRIIGIVPPARFTTVADQGALTNRLLVLRDSINAGQIEGPRVLAAGIWVGTKGGVCEFTDGGVLPHSHGVDEMEALVIGDSVGRPDVGMAADFVAVRGAPLRDVAALRNVELVVSRGRVAVGPPQ